MRSLRFPSIMIVVAAGLLIAATFVGAPTPLEPSQQARAVLSPLSVEASTGGDITPRNFEFTISNLESATVRFDPIQFSSERATLEGAIPKQLRRGETAKFAVRVVPLKFAMTTVTLSLPYRSGAESRILKGTISIQGKRDGVPAVVEDPLEINLRRYTPGIARREFDLRIREHTEDSPCLRGFQVSDPQVKLVILNHAIWRGIDVDVLERTYHCLVERALSDSESRHGVATVEFISSGPYISRRLLQVTYELLPQLTAYPVIVRIDMATLKEDATRFIQLLWEDPTTTPAWKDIKFESPAGIDADIVPSDDPSRGTLRLKLREVSPGEHRVRLTRQSGESGMHLLDVTVAVHNAD